MTIDFTIALGIFLVAIGFTATFVFTVMAPFTDTATQDTVVANQAADHLVESALQADGNSGGAPSEVDTECTVAFFNGTQDAPSCSLPEGETPGEMADALVGAEADDGTTVNVRIEELNESVVYMNNLSFGISPADYDNLVADDPLDTDLDTGEGSDDRFASTAATSRIVVFDGEIRRIVVSVR